MTRLTAVLVAGILALAGCGGGDGEDSAEQQIREAVTAFYESEEGVCDSVTDDLLEEQFGSRQACERAARASEPTDDYEIGEISVEGENATAGSLVLKKEDGEWKVDGIQQ